MGVQFPNFLGVPVRSPDYSGLGDIFHNYYAGKAMPKDDLMKAIQAEFARPTAEQALLSSKLSNKKSQLDITKMAQEMAEQAAFEKQLRQAFSQSQQPNQQPMNMPLPPARNYSPMPMPVSPPPNITGMPGVSILGEGSPLDEGTDRTKMDAHYRKFDQEANGLPSSAYTGNPMEANAPISPSAMPIAPTSPRQAEPALNETVITKGSPHLVGVDMMYENNPLSRAFLEKKGYKKTQEVKFDNKTGKTTILTKYPSGKITVQSVGGAGSASGDIPLTNANITKQQGIIASIDNTLPAIKDILALDKSTEKNPEWEPYPRSSGYQPGLGWLPGLQSKSANYEALVSSALDTLLGAYGLPKTNEGIETVKKQLLIAHGETDKAYKARLRRLMEDLERRKKYSEGLVKKSNTISPVDTSAGGSGSESGYSSNEWEAV